MIETTDKTFNKEVLESDKPVLIEFWASWCIPCKMMEYVLKELESEYNGKVKIVKFNIDRYRKIPKKYKLTGVPTFMTFKNGEVCDQKVGALSKKDLEELIKKNID